MRARPASASSRSRISRKSLSFAVMVQPYRLHLPIPPERTT
jgi:hypothetical protein